jgi:2-polyprenyl-3-methyl-5-hydroxy-6-metoxy-1,4-benzoquinol methylase
MSEYSELLRRNYGIYSLGHRLMYQVPLLLMMRSDAAPQRFSILDVGFGIGWGLEQMIEADVIERYRGFEPDQDSFEYVRNRHGKNSRLTLLNAEFSAADEFDHVFCIEVAEHVAPPALKKFLAGLRRSTRGTLWFSTPDSVRVPQHGALPAEQWSKLLRAAGFRSVTHHAEQWTDLYCCQ